MDNLTKDTNSLLKMALACKANQPEKMAQYLRCFIDEGVSICSQISMDGRKESILHICARYNAYQCLKQILDSGLVDVSTWNVECKTALRIAREAGNNRTAEVLENYPLNRIGAQGPLYNQQTAVLLVKPMFP